MQNAHKENYCSVCGFLGEFFPAYMGASLRESLCPQCSASRQVRDVAKVLLAYVNMHNACLTNSLEAFKNLHILEFQAQGPIHTVLKSLPHYTATDFFAGDPSGSLHTSGILSQDLHCLTFLNATQNKGFDIVISQDVFEHLENPWLAFKEVERILRPKGQHIFTVPVHTGFQTTVRATRDTMGNIIHTLPAVHHGDPLTQKACLVFTDFGDDLPEILQKHEIHCEYALYEKFYTPSQIPQVNTIEDHKRYNFFISRKKGLSFFLYNSVVFKAYGKATPFIKQEHVRIRFKDYTNTLQCSIKSDFFDCFDYSLNSPTISSLRGERIDIFGKSTLALDIIFSSHDGKTNALLMVELIMGELSTITFPSMFQQSLGIHKFVHQVFAYYIDILKTKETPFYIDTHGIDIEKVSERMLPGISSYYTVIPNIRRYAFVIEHANIKKCASACLDIGCGEGYGLAMLSNTKNGTGVGLDISSSAIINAKKNYASTNITWIEQSVEFAAISTSLPRKYFSVITCFENIEHLDAPEPCLDLVKQCLTPQGKFYVSVPNPHMHGVDKNYYHKRDYTFLHMKTLLEANFSHVEFFSQSDATGDLSQRFLIKKEEDADAQFWIACCQKPIRSRKSCIVSIIMPLYDKFAYTVVAVDKIYSTMPSNISWEIILIDNGSKDETKHYRPKDEKTYILRNSQNEGFAKACNQGALLAKGEFLVFLKNDTEVQKGWIEALLNELQSHPKTGLVSGRLLYPDHTIQHAGIVIGRDSIPYHIYNRYKHDDPLVLNRQEYPIVTRACLATRHNNFFNVGMFDELFIDGHEDIDLCIRYRNKGFHCIYRHDCVVIHHETISEGRMNSRLENVKRTFAKSKQWLEQDDFIYKALPLNPTQFHTRKMRFAIKIGVHNRNVQDWEDIYFAESFAKKLISKGHTCEIHYLNEWGRDDKNIDVVVHINGLLRYYTKPWNINIMWMIDHPDLHTIEELECYDAICVASDIHAQQLKKILKTPVYTLLQATDPEHFCPQNTELLSEKNQKELNALEDEYDIVFVGSNNGTGKTDIRKIVDYLLSAPKKNFPFSLAVWGFNWEHILPKGCHKGDFISWEVLPHVYKRAKIVLNDHQINMAEHGFINNKTYDIAACGVPQICDAVAGMENIIDIKQCTNAKSLQNAIKDIFKNYAQTKERAEKMRETVLQNFTFAKRVDELYDIIEAIQSSELAERIKTSKDNAFADSFLSHGPLVSILMSTYNRPIFLPAAIQSILNQTYNNWELYLVCDGGTPVNSIIQQFNDSRIHLLHVNHNQGKPKCINTAFEMSKGEYIAYLDDDDTWRQDHIEKNMRALCHISGFDMAYSNAHEVIIDLKNPVYPLEISRELRYDTQVSLEQLIEFNQITGISVIHSRELFTKAGKFDEKLKVLIDFDMWRRLACFSYAYHVSYVTADYYFRKNLPFNLSITSLFEKDILSYIKNRIKILYKKLNNGMEEKYTDILIIVRHRVLFEFFYTLCEQAIKNKNMKRCKNLLPIVVKYCNSIQNKSKLAVFLMKIEYFEQALIIFKDIFIFSKKNISTLFMMLICALHLKNSIALDVFEALKKNIDSMSDQEKEVFYDYETRMSKIQAIEKSNTNTRK